jgi:carbonic anhydrase
MSGVAKFVQRNTERAERGTNLAALAVAPSLHTSIVTCMDARMDLYDLFGLEPGEAHVIRNAGGVVTDDVIRSLSISQFRLDTTEILLAQHTECGMSSMTDDELKNELLEFSGLTPTWSVESFTDVEASVRQGMMRIRRSPFLKHSLVLRGFVVDLSAGAMLQEVF